MRRDNPLDGIAPVKLPKSKGHPTSTDDQIAQYRKHWKLGTEARLTIELALETVSRRGEVVGLGPQHCYVDAEGNRHRDQGGYRPPRCAGRLGLTLCQQAL